MGRRTLLALGFGLLLANSAAATPPAEPAGFRGPPYSAPVPATLAGAKVADDATAAALHAAGEAVFVDVMPRDIKPADLPEGTIWRDKPRDSIPGAIWLPNTGFEALSPEEEAYLRAGLAHATAGNLDQPMVIFCRAECWMSWNVAKRAIGYGYSQVIWYPNGPEGWQTVPNPPLERVEPFVLP
ncbi:MAG: PQQ-dependent catabolism-associated CXXCW motif protein [Paracoccaceae bacterium]